MSAIAKTSSITLITGVPGSGKTLRTVWYMKKAVAAGEMVFACNVNGLKLGNVTDFPDPTQWQTLPPGSILVVDEAQKFFRPETTDEKKLRAKEGDPKQAPDYILAMETIRHMGIRLILMTQHPALLHPNIRALTGLHEHLVAENGKQQAVIYRRSSVIDNVRSHTALEREDKERWNYPKEIFAEYESAEVHTKSRTFHSKTKKGYLMLAGAAIVMGLVYYRISDRLQDEQGTIVEQGAETANGPRGPETAATGRNSAGREERPMVFTAEEYAKLYTPLIASAPWTAPAFTNRQAIADPTLVCMSSGAGETEDGYRQGTCRCLTERGTRYTMPEKQCRDLARHGPMYNPFRSASENSARAFVGDQQITARGSRGPEGAGQRPAVMNAPAFVPSSVMSINGDDAAQTRYGGFRGTPIPADPSFGG